MYFAFMNLQISFAFLVATYFSNVRIATGMLLLDCFILSFFSGRSKLHYSNYIEPFGAVTGYLFTIGSGFLGEFLFRPVFEDISLSSLYAQTSISWLNLLRHALYILYS
jgi:hypothetical protein